MALWNPMLVAKDISTVTLVSSNAYSFLTRPTFLKIGLLDL
jgi:hypothetical protein